MLFWNRARTLRAGEVTTQPTDLGVRGEDQHVFEVGRGGVGEEFLIHNKNGGADIAEISAQASPGKGAGRLITDVVITSCGEYSFIN